MPDRPNYNTRLRTNSVLLLPRRLRHSPTPPPRPRHVKSKDAITHNIDSPTRFPPANVVLHPEDAANKTLSAIGRAMLAVDNRAITIKDLSQLSLDCGLLCQNASAASQAITTFIRNHLNRCHQDRTRPLLLSLALTGTAADDRLAPALHSRSGGTSSTKEPERSLTSFRRGTTVWYLSESAGAPCPFKRAGLCIDEITGTSQGTKRKRESHHTPPRKLSAPNPAMTTRTRAQAEAASSTTSRLRVKLTLKVRDPPLPCPSDADSDSESSSSDLSDLEPEFDHREGSNASRASSMSVDSSITDELNSLSDSESIIQVDESIPVFSPDLPPYPILSASIPSPSCTTPATSLGSPSVTFADPFSPHNSSSALCSSHFVNTPFSSFRTALSNLPQDHRARSRSLPFSAASPPPDSEDEDEDYHNSMIGLRRGSAPLPLKKEEEDEEGEPIPKLEPVTPKYVPGSIHLAMKNWHPESMTMHKQEHTSQGVSTPLEHLPGFVSFSPEPESDDPPGRVPVKNEPTSAVLPPASPKVFRWGAVNVKPEHTSDEQRTVLDPEETPPQVACAGKGTRADPVRIEAVVGDVEVLGPESVRSREWDAAWCSAGSDTEEREGDGVEDDMDVDGVVEEGRTRIPSLECQSDLRASPAETLATVPTSISSPPSELIPIDGERDTPFLMHPLRPCEPPVVATVIEGIPVYHTLLAPGLSLLRRIDTSFVNLTPLMVFLGLPLSALVSHTHAAPRISVSRAPEPFGGTWVPLSVAQGVARHAGPGQIPQGVRDVFLSADLGMWFPDALVRLVQLHGKNAGIRTGAGEYAPALVKEVGIRVEDVFTGAENTELKQEARFKPDLTLEFLPPVLRNSSAAAFAGVLPTASSIFFESPRSAFTSIPLSLPLDEQEETLFHSFVDFLESGAPTGGTSASSSPLSSPPSSPLAKPAVTAAVMTSSAKEKENATKPEATFVRRKREKAAEMPVRRSKRALAAKLSAPVTRSRSRGNCSDGRAI